MVNPKDLPALLKLVVSEDTHCSSENPMDYLLSSDSGDGDVCVVCVRDKGSRQHCANVEVQGVGALGVVDTSADITIMGGELFKKVAAVAQLKKDFKLVDEKPYTCGDQPFKLDGRMDLDISFNGKTMCTPVYIKMDSQEALLLSEGVCRQLGMVTYHSRVVARGEQGHSCHEGQNEAARVPVVRVRLVDSVRLLPLQSMMATVELKKSQELDGPLLLEPTHRFSEAGGLQFGSSLVYPSKNRCAAVILTNPTGFTQKLKRGMWVGRASEAEIVSEDSQEILSEDLTSGYWQMEG